MGGNIIEKANDKLQIVFNQFVEEKIGNSQIKMMPPSEKIPVIEKFNYDTTGDIFEIVF